MLLCTQRQFYPTKMQKTIPNRKFRREKITVSICTITNRIALPLMEIFFSPQVLQLLRQFYLASPGSVYGLKIVLVNPKHPKSIYSGLICQKTQLIKSSNCWQLGKSQFFGLFSTSLFWSKKRSVHSKISKNDLFWLDFPRNTVDKKFEFLTKSLD